jgi:hypothetical protein
MHQAAALEDFGSRPLIVVTAGREHDAEWFPAQEKLASLSTNGRQRIVKDATHASLVYDRVDSAAVSQAVRDVVVAVRTSQPLG